MSAKSTTANRLNLLALNNDGFVFNPSTGDSYTVNRSGLSVLRGMREGKSTEEIANAIAVEFGITLQDAERDVMDFTNCLKNFRLL